VFCLYDTEVHSFLDEKWLEKLQAQHSASRETPKVQTPEINLTDSASTGRIGEPESEINYNGPDSPEAKPTKIPKGFRPPAQACEARANLGSAKPKSPYLEEVVPSLMTCRLSRG